MLIKSMMVLESAKRCGTHHSVLNGNRPDLSNTLSRYTSIVFLYLPIFIPLSLCFGFYWNVIEDFLDSCSLPSFGLILVPSPRLNAAFSSLSNLTGHCDIVTSIIFDTQHHVPVFPIATLQFVL